MISFTSKDEFQAYSLSILKEHGFNGTIVADTGVSKSKIGIDAIAAGNFKKVLIVSPRTNLKESWKTEINKWLPIEIMHEVSIVIENIQTAFKWERHLIEHFDLIIYDEVHSCGEEFFRLLKNAECPIIGLTATPGLEDEFKSTILYDKIPILLTYTNGESDGLINKTKYWIFEYELNDFHRILAGTKSKKWMQGELKAYQYADNVFQETTKAIQDSYFAELCERTEDRISRNVHERYKLDDLEIEQLREAVSKDYAYYVEYVKPFYTTELNKTFYFAWKEIRGYNYARLGTKAYQHFSSTEVSTKVASLLAKYTWALNARKSILWGLSSGVVYTKAIKQRILENTDNKVLLFSELTEQADKLSEYTVHSKNGETVKKILKNNEELIKRFDSGEIREMASCLSLTLGLNLKGANWIIFESYSGSKINGKQKVGRGHRLNASDVANIVILRPKGTQMGDVWFEDAFGWIENYTVINSIDQIVI